MTRPDPIPTLLRPREVAESLGLSVNCVRSRLRSGRLPGGVMYSEREIRMDAAALRDYIESGRVENRITSEPLRTELPHFLRR